MPPDCAKHECDGLGILPRKPEDKPAQRRSDVKPSSWAMASMPPKRRPLCALALRTRECDCLGPGKSQSRLLPSYSSGLQKALARAYSMFLSGNLLGPRREKSRSAAEGACRAAFRRNPPQHKQSHILLSHGSSRFSFLFRYWFSKYLSKIGSSLQALSVRGFGSGAVPALII